MRLWGSGIGRMPFEQLGRVNPGHEGPRGHVHGPEGVANQSSWKRAAAGRREGDELCVLSSDHLFPSAER